MNINRVKNDKQAEKSGCAKFQAELNNFSCKIPESAGEAFSLTEKIQKLVTDYVIRLDTRDEKIDVYNFVINLLSNLADKSQGGAKVLILSSVDYWEIALRQENVIFKNSVSNNTVSRGRKRREWPSISIPWRSNPASRGRERRRRNYLMNSDYPVVAYRAKPSDYRVGTYQPETKRATHSMRISDSSKVSDLTLNKKTELENLYTKK